MLSAKNSLELLKSIEIENLYLKLIKQLNKDFQLSNLDFSFEETLSPLELKEKIIVILLNLISNKYDDYLNFLYRVDVSEKELLKIRETDLPSIVNQIAFLILKREYQKVWLKRNY